MLRENRGRYDALTVELLHQELVWLNDIPVATIRLVPAGGGSVGVFYIHTDHLNAPSKITRPTDNVVIWRWDHDPYGNGIPNEDPDGNGLVLNFNLRYPGQYFDAETGLNYNYYRDYDPSTGRYVESDPIGLYGGQFSTYAYVGGNPISMIDPYGLFGMDDIYGAIYNGTGGWTPSQGLIDYTAGFGDAVSLNITSLIRNQMGTNDAVDKCSKFYRAGGWTSFALGSGRLAYAGLAKGYSLLAASGSAASAFRSALRVAFGGGESLRPPNLSQYLTDDALRAAAGRTNPFANLYGAGVAAKGAAEGSGCGCSQ